MTLIALPALYALFVWWFSTGAIFYLDGLPRRSFAWSMAGATILATLALYGLLASRSDATAGGAYVAFTSGLVIWAWLEMTYYMGFVTGMRLPPCPHDCTGWRHFGHAVQTNLYHELATIGLAALILYATWGSTNRVALWTFVVLWWMQISAKLNVFLGVPNLDADFLPEHLDFLKSFLRRKPMNLLFPVSITVSIVLATMVAERALSESATAFEATAASFLAALMALAILEHWFLVVPLPVSALWRWSLASRDPAGPSAPDEQHPPVPHAAEVCQTCTPSSRLGETSFPRTLVAGVFAEAGRPHPQATALVRRTL